MENEFESNAHADREARTRTVEKAPVKRVTQITRGKVVQRKKPLYKKFFEAFRPEDGQGFVEYTLLEVIVPGFKDLVADASTGAIENALGVGHSSRGRRRRRSGGGYTSYNSMGNARPHSRRDRDRDDRDDRRSRSSSDLPELILDSRVEANEVVDTLIELISKYELCTVRDLLGLVGEPHNPTDEDWGWTDLRGARVHRVGGGYLLDLPRPVSLD